MNSDRYPILKILIPYIIGIIIAYLCDFHRLNCILSVSVISVILIFSSLLFAKSGYKLQWIPSILLAISSVFIGVLLTNFHFSPKFDAETEKKIVSERFWAATVVSVPVVKERIVKVEARLQKLLGNDSFPLSEKVILYIRNDTLSRNLCCGDRLLLNTQLERAPPPKNPFAFDNCKFLRRRGIWFTGFVEAGRWKKIASTFSLRQEAAHLQSVFSKRFAAAGLEGDEYAVITAILLGDDDTMPPALKASYASAGVSHILCVSGMHVGIIFMILNFILKPLTANRITNIAKTILLLLFIWFYAHITGLSPSVLRAATMFSFVALGSLLKRNTDIFHSLFASLFFMLLANPLLIFEVGLQLSYAAVFGIVIFQPIIAKLWQPKTKIAGYFWGLATVSVAAQLSTFPLSVFYFNQFPNYFLISNLSVIFLSFITVISGIVTICVSFIPPIATFCGTILCYEIKTMNCIIGFVDSLPGSLTDNISWSFAQVIALYILMIFLFLFFKFKNTRHLIITLSAFLIFLIINNIHIFRNSKTNEMTIYSINGRSCIGINNSGDGALFSDTLFRKNDKDYNYVIKNHEVRCQIKNRIFDIDGQSKEKNFVLNYNCLCFNEKRMYILNHERKLFRGCNVLKTDYLLLSGNPIAKPEDVVASVDFGMVIADENNSEYCRTKWKKWCYENDIRFYDINKEGAFIVKIN